MSLIDRFTIGYQLEKDQNKNTFENNETNLRINQITDFQKDILQQDICEALIEFGFKIEQIMISFKVYKFNTLDDAVYILMKDTDTGKYNHRYFKNENENATKIVNNDGQFYNNVNGCFICGGSMSEHVDFEFREIKLEIDNVQDNHGEDNVNQIYSQKNHFVINNGSINHNTNANTNIYQEDKINRSENTNFNSSMNNTDNKLTGLNKSNNLGDYLRGKNKENDIVEKKVLLLPKINNNIQIDKETLEAFEDPNICTICFSEIMNDTNKAEFACGHKFCRKCVTNHISTSINNGKVLLIKCLYGGCPKTFVEDEIRMFIGDQLYIKFRKFKLNQLKLNNPSQNYINCPYPDCGDLIEISNIIREEPFIQCELGHKFCAKCKSNGWHSRGKCNDYVTQVLNQIQKDNRDSVNYKQCPQCSVIIEKNEGCNQMKCINCNYEFCWLCMKRYTGDHYAIYNFRGCPGMRFNSVRKSKLWNNPLLKTLWLILSCIMGVLAVILIIVFFAFFGCAYEFTKCYIDKKINKQNEDEENSNFEYNIEQNYRNNNENEVRLLNLCDKFILVILILVGLLCQPIYLLIYLLYALMECYRRFNCWFYYIDS